MGKIILENIEFISITLILPAITWFFSKRHFQSRELKNQDVELIRQNLNLYQTLLNDIQQRYETQLAKLYNDIKLLEEEIERLKSIINNCN